LTVSGDNHVANGKGLNVLHVIPTFFPATFWGGPIHSVYGLCNALARQPNVHVSVLTTDSAGPRRDQRVEVGQCPWTSPSGYPVYHCRRLWNNSVSPGLLRRLVRMVQRADVVHLTSVYSFPTIPTLLLCLVFAKPLVWSPRGQLQRWEGSTGSALKHLWELLCNRLLAPQRSVLHVTSQQEADESRRRVARARIAVVANGVDYPAGLGHRQWLPAGVLRLLYIGRLDPKKGIENLIEALATLDGRVTLRLCGTGDVGYQKALHKRVGDLGLTDRVNFAGHVTGDAKSRAFLESDICVVPSFTENFAMVVAEALAHGVPVIASRGTPWAALNEHACGMWVKNDPASLAEAISGMRECDLEQWGRNGRRWMKSAFSWDQVAEHMVAIYRTVVAGSGVASR
jgi:glycosyltransferase involved in cell wall biosynthesis